MSIAKIIEELRQRDIIPNREMASLSFGTREQCKQSFVEIFKSVDNTIKTFRYYKAYDEVIDWLADNKGQGLALFGSVGTGKSVILRCVMPVYFRAQYNKYIRVIGLPDFLTMQPEEMRDYLHRTIIAIDELGREPMAVDFGKKYEAVPILIESCEIHSKLLFITSNATESQIIDRYGLHTMDRINKLCKIVVISDKSSR